MRLMKFLILGVFLTVSPALAQDDVALYRVTDVAIDVSAKSAADARDQAIMQAQKQALGQLLSRLGVSGKVTQVKDDTVASLVKAFEVQKENATGQRYKGLFTVQFKPDAVRKYLDQGGMAYSEERSSPVVVLPLTSVKNRNTLWEDRTAWRDAWDDGAKASVLVPVLLPPGDLEDIAKISTAEAMAGKADSLQSLIHKYEAGGAVVAIFRAEEDGKEAPIQGKLDVRVYEQDGSVQRSFEVNLDPKTAKSLRDELAQGVKQIIKGLEESWREAQNTPKETAEPAIPQALPSVEVRDEALPRVSPSVPSYLPINVPVPTLAAWAQIRNKMARAAPVMATNVISMTRGLVHAEVQFRGDLGELQAALAEQGLMMDVGPEGGWEIRDEHNRFDEMQE